MLDCPLDPDANEICWMLASQLGKTLCLILIIGYFIAKRPTKILMVYPKLQDVLDWMRDKALPAFHDMPCMEGLLKEPRQRDSNSTALNRKFPGGGLVGVGSMSTSSLRRVSAQLILQDEIDDFETTPQGDSMALADMRAETFHNAVKIKSSTPTHKGSSRIEAKYEKSDQRRYFVPCPACGHMQHLRWAQFKWKFTRDGQEVSDTANAFYECESCQAHWTDQDRQAAIFDPRSKWMATMPPSRIRGYHLNGLYRVIGKKKAFNSYHHEFAENFLAAKAGGRETIMVWVNTFLAETYADPTKEIDWHPLMARAEEYGPELPEEVTLLNAGLDVQADRVEIGVIGWAEEEECWWIENHVVWGDFDLPQTQQQVDDFLLRKWQHPSGVEIGITAAAIDSAHKTKAVYKFCRTRAARRIWAVRGSSTPYAPLITPSTKRHYGLTLFSVGTDTAKDSIFGRLEILEPGARYIHFPKGKGFDEKFYRQLCSEKIVETFERGVYKRRYVKTQARNEALDKFVYAIACYDILKPNIPRIRASIMGGKESVKKEYEIKPEPAQIPQPQLPAAMRKKRPKYARPAMQGGTWNPLRL